MLATVITIVFILTYVVMAKGYIPRTKLARTEVALIAAGLILLFGVIPLAKIPSIIQYPTLIILFVLMLFSAQFNQTYFYDWCATKIAAYNGSTVWLLFLVVMVSGVLSAILANDVIAFAMTPILCSGLLQRKLNPKPFLFALMAACNAGSAATIIGNPQNILIAEYGNLNFLEFLKICAFPALLALFVVFILIWVIYRKDLAKQPEMTEFYVPTVNKSQTALGILFLVVLIALFFTDIPRYLTALVLGALFVALRWRMAKPLLSRVDWRLLLLFLGLFVVNAGFEQTGIPEVGVSWLISHGVTLNRLSILVPYTFIGSNTIGNVPAVILTLTLWPQQTAQTLYSFALLTTLAGNAFIFSSLANIIVAERARINGVKIYFVEHLKAGLPITLITMLIASWWLWWKL